MATICTMILRQIRSRHVVSLKSVFKLSWNVACYVVVPRIRLTIGTSHSDSYGNSSLHGRETM